MNLSAHDILLDSAARVDAWLADYFDHAGDCPQRLIEAIRYSVEAPGKRLRPALVLETFRALDGTDEAAALAAAAAIELVHTFSLVHDDLPAMDDDDLRRGRPTNHKVYGEALAILAGDAMLSMAFDVLGRFGGKQAIRLVGELAAATGPTGMVGGQVLDIQQQGCTLSLTELQRLHRMKTGALIAAACRMGAIAAAAPQERVESLDQFGRNLGLAFQIVDDILDETSSAEEMGKQTHKDVAAGKNTYPRLLGLDASRNAAQAALADARRALDPLGCAGDRLRALAEFVVCRGDEAPHGRTVRTAPEKIVFGQLTNRWREIH